jgi:hypothetical protein
VFSRLTGIDSWGHGLSPKPLIDRKIPLSAAVNFFYAPSFSCICQISEYTLKYVFRIFARYLPCDQGGVGCLEGLTSQLDNTHIHNHTYSQRLPCNPA